MYLYGCIMAVISYHKERPACGTNSSHIVGAYNRLAPSPNLLYRADVNKTLKRRGKKHGQEGRNK
jgi:hypothetical protein